jgi:hypothetical protein
MPAAMQTAALIALGPTGKALLCGSRALWARGKGKVRDPRTKSGPDFWTRKHGNRKHCATALIGGGYFTLAQIKPSAIIDLWFPETGSFDGTL